MTSDAAPAQMPEKLREILSEPGWRKHRYSQETWVFEIETLNLNAEYWAEITVEHQNGWWVYFESDGTMGTEGMDQAATLMRRIEQAMSAGDGAGEDSEG